MAGLENYTFRTPRAEIKQSNLYLVSTGALLGRFSNAATVVVWYPAHRVPPLTLPVNWPWT